jgi:hypothetical protein
MTSHRAGQVEPDIVVVDNFELKFSEKGAARVEMDALATPESTAEG